MIDERWVVKLNNKPYVLFPGLLHLAHESGLRSIETELVQIPGAENGQMAIIRALVTFQGGEGPVVWSAYGDASPANTRMAAAAIRIAETRAIGRALRMACDVGETMLEELDDAEVAGERANGKTARPASVPEHPHPQQPAERASGGHAARASVGAGKEPDQVVCAVCKAPLTKSQQTYSQHHCKMNLCKEHADAMRPDKQPAGGS